MEIKDMKKSLLDRMEADAGFVDELREDPVNAIKGFISEHISPEQMEELVSYALEHIPGVQSLIDEVPVVGAAGLGLGNNGIPGVGNSTPGIPR